MQHTLWHDDQLLNKKKSVTISIHIFVMFYFPSIDFLSIQSNKYKIKTKQQQNNMNDVH